MSGFLFEAWMEATHGIIHGRIDRSSYKGANRACSRTVQLVNSTVPRYRMISWNSFILDFITVLVLEAEAIIKRRKTKSLRITKNRKLWSPLITKVLREFDT